VRLQLGDVTVAPELALGAWAGFSDAPDHAMLMGDLVVTTAELRPVLAELARQDLEVTAIHNHLVGEEPRLIYVHFHGDGARPTSRPGSITLIALTATPRPVAPASPSPLTIDSAAVFRALGVRARHTVRCAGSRSSSCPAAWPWAA